MPVGKYCKRPVEIEAVQWTGENINEIYDFVGEGRKINYVSNELSISTLEGWHCASIGDFIIKGVKGECYPCKPDIFNKTYFRSDGEASCVIGSSDGDRSFVSIKGSMIDAMAIWLAVLRNMYDLSEDKETFSGTMSSLIIQIFENDKHSVIDKVLIAILLILFPIDIFLGINCLMDGVIAFGAIDIGLGAACGTLGLCKWLCRL